MASLSRAAGQLLLASLLVASVAPLAGAQSIPPPGEGWSEPERWAWDQIRAGRIVDFNAREEGEALDPRNPGDWDEGRRLNGRFLREILFREPYRESIPVEGVRIVGAWFPETVDLANGRLDRQLWLDQCRFGGAVDLAGLRVDGWLSLRGSAVAEQSAKPAPVSLYGAEINGSINMNRIMFRDVELGDARVTGQLVMHDATVKGVLRMRGLEVGQHLLMRGATFQDVDLASARIGTQLDMSSTTINRALDMDSIEVGQHLLMRGATFHDLNLSTARVAGQLNLDGATGRGFLNMDGLNTGQHLLMREPATFRDVELANAQVAGQLSMSGAVVTGQLGMDGLEVEQTLFMRGARFEKQVDLIFAHIGNLQLSGADFSGAGFTELDLSATRIEGELDLGSGATPAPRWREGARLTLRDTHTGTLRDRLDAWEGLELQLDGFTYGRLGGFGGVAADVPARGIGWYIAWLARDPSYAPQPYEQLATVFRAAGKPAKADDILYESRARARKEAADWWRWLGLNLSWLTIGYGLGLGYFRTLWWVLGFTLLGTAVLVWQRQGPERLSAKAFFSLDRLLPRLVELDKTHDEVEAGLKGWVRRYFYLHKIVGYVLAGFLLAGLAGLTQR
jgi:uncharacterized protein YjbI with pentapeptide repeats